MGIQDLGEQEALIARKELTIGDLESMFGREATRRGLEYMRSLDDADETFREKVDEDDMTEGYRRAGVRGNIEPASEKWKESSEKEGLGLDED